MVLPTQGFMTDLVHNYSFDPTHGYNLGQLLRIEAPEEPPDYENFWRDRHSKALTAIPKTELRDTGMERRGWRIFDWSYVSTDCMRIQGWALLPSNGVVRRGFLIGHGYDGRKAPEFDLPFTDAALFFHCARGLGRSWNRAISAEARWHVLHDIQSKRRYILGGCVEDVWVAVTAMLTLFPELDGHLGYLGISFSGGIGAMALAWEDRIARAHLKVPSFGNQPLRLRLPSVGSASSVQQFVTKCPKLLEVLRYYDAAIAARRIRVPVHCACALFDPAVAPAGQFAIYNAIQSPKNLFVLTAGHHAYPGQELEEARLCQEINNFFRDL